MINLEKVSSKVNIRPFPKIKTKNNTIGQQSRTDLNAIPHYKIITPLSIARKYLSEFNLEYGEINSSTYASLKIQQAKSNGLDENSLDKLYEENRILKSKVKKLRKVLWSMVFETYEDYLNALSDYVKKQGAYINCNETANLVQYLLKKDGIKSQNVYLYTVDKNGDRINKAEHVFCVIGLDKNADIQDVSTWGAACAICDPWAGIAMSAQDGIEFYEKLFNIDKNEQRFSFELNENYFPGMKDR